MVVAAVKEIISRTPAAFDGVVEQNARNSREYKLWKNKVNNLDMKRNSFDSQNVRYSYSYM